MTLIHTIYISTATREMGDAELADLLEVSRRNNLRDGITGMLLYGNGRFMQVLEGESQLVDNAMERIKADSRHRSVFILERHVNQIRDFAQWSMGFRVVSDAAIALHPGFSDFFSSSFDSYGAGIQYGPPLLMLKAFAKDIPI